MGHARATRRQSAVAKTISTSGLIAMVATCVLMVSACGSSSSSSKASVSPSPTPTPKATVISTVDACTLVTAADASTAIGTPATSLGGAGAASGVCIYGSADGSTSVVVFAQAYPDASSANAVNPQQMAAALNGAYGIANGSAKVVSGIGDKAVEYTVTSAASSTTGTVIFVFKSNVLIMIAISPLSDTTKLEDLARTAVGKLH